MEVGSACATETRGPTRVENFIGTSHRVVGN